MTSAEGEAKRIAEAVAIAFLSSVAAGFASWGVEQLKARVKDAEDARVEAARARVKASLL